MSTSIPVRSNGQVIDQSWFNTPRSEISTLDDRLDALGGSSNVIVFNANGYYAAGGSKDSIIVFPITKSITATSVRLTQLTAGASGSVKVDLKFKRGSGSWTSMLSTAPIVPASAGDNANSATGTGATAGVINATYEALVPDDLVRLDLQQVPGGTPDSFIFTLYHSFDGV